MKNVYIMLLAIVFVVGLFFLLNKRGNGENVETKVIVEPIITTAATPMPTTIPTSMETIKSKNVQALMTTSVGEITIQLFADKTPLTVNNFVTLAKKNFYNNTVFHRVIKGFMIQGGDPNGDGTGSPGYTFADEPFEGEYTRGTVAMANAGPNTNGSQFFIMHQDYALPKNYVIFGKVVSGIETVDKIAEAPTAINPGSGENSKPVTSVVVKSVTIVEN